MTTAARVLDIARAEIGYVQAANGSNKFGQFYGMDRVAWCNQFTFWCLSQAGAAHLTPKSAYTPTTFNWYKAKGLTGSQPRVGALVFFNWPGDGVNRIQHIGFVEAVNSDGSITTIEGNTSSGTAGSQSYGGGVWRRKRSGSSIVGYAYPEYSSGAAQPAPAPVPGAKPGMPVWNLKPGQYLGHKNGPAASIGGYYGPHPLVMAVQRKFIYLGMVPGVSDPNSGWADGVWEDATTAACRRWFAKFRPEQQFHDQIWSDDYRILAAQ